MIFNLTERTEKRRLNNINQYINEKKKKKNEFFSLSLNSVPVGRRDMMMSFFSKRMNSILHTARDEKSTIDFITREKERQYSQMTTSLKITV
jgi:hypothetical protein